MNRDYRSFSNEFYSKYCYDFDNNFLNLRNVFSQGCNITFLSEEFVGFDNLLNSVSKMGVYKFSHQKYTYYAQPIDNKSVIITSTGTISVNGSIFGKKYIETLTIHTDDFNVFYIHNMIFQLIE